MSGLAYTRRHAQLANLVGVQLGQYEIVELLGKGGMAEVYRAHQRMAAGKTRPVAIKVMDPHYSNDSDYVTRFHREADIMLKLSNPHVIQLFDVGQIESGEGAGT